jgi:hypothetical protein
MCNVHMGSMGASKFTTLSTIVALEGQDSILFVVLNFSFQNLTNYSNIIVIHHGLHSRTIKFLFP